MSVMTKRMEPVKKVHARKLLTSLFVVMLCVALFSSQISAFVPILIEPVTVAGNPALEVGGVRIPDPPVGEKTWKIDSTGVETNPDENFMPADFWVKTIVMPSTEVSGEIFSFMSNYPVCKIVVKGGDKANVYTFPTPEYGYMGLHAPINASGKFADISHIDFYFCNPKIDVEKLVSVDGGTTWDDADAAPGPTLNEWAGIKPKFKFIVKNTGDVDLSCIKLTDDHFQSLLDEEEISTTLAAGKTFEIVIEAPWAKGQHVNTAAVVGDYKGIEVKDEDKAHYTGIEAKPAIDVEKHVWVEETDKWEDADSKPGPTISDADGDVKFKFIVKNTGNVDLADVELTDDHYQTLLDEEDIPATLKAGESFEVVIDAPWVEGEHINIATVVGKYREAEVKDEDQACYTGEKEFEAKPDIDVTKTVADAADGTYGKLVEIEAGENAFYKVVVKNSGNVALTGVVLMDDMVKDGTEATIDGQAGVKTFVKGEGDYPELAIGTLEPGQEVVVRYTYLTKNKDIGDTIINAVVATGMHGQIKVSDEDDAAITVVKIPLAVSSIKLEKWVRNQTQSGVFAEMATGFVNDVFEYSIKITNDGDTNLTNVVLHDTFAKIGVDVHIYEGDVLKGDAKWVNDGSGHAKLVIGDLAAGASLTIKYLYTAVAADEGDVYENLAVVNAEFQGLPLEASDKAVITILKTPPQTGESDGMALGGIVLLFTGALALVLRRKIRQAF